MADRVRMSVNANPRLLADLVELALRGPDVDLVDASDGSAVVSIVTADLAGSARGRVVIVLDDDPEGSAQVIVDGQWSGDRRVAPEHLRMFAIDLAHHIPPQIDRSAAHRAATQTQH